MSAKCNTCNGVPISTNCLRYEGNDLFISSELEDKRDFNKLIEKEELISSKYQTIKN